MNLNEPEIIDIIAKIKQESPSLSVPFQAHLMIEDWNDKMIVLEDENAYVMHHRRTTE
jgi:hypothetical protein